MNNITKLFLALSIVLLMGGCTKGYLDVNDDPNVPTIPDLSQLLSGSQLYMVKALSQDNFIGNGLSSYTHHLVSREVQNYSMTPGNGENNIFNTWNYLCTYALVDFDLINKLAESEGNLIYAGIAKTLKAYAFSVMVDLWGDVPYSEFNVPGLRAPKPDSSKDIYNALFALLDEAHADLENKEAANLLKPGKDDFFYGGNAEKWISLNNTLKLRLLLHSRKAKSDIEGWQGKLDALIAENNFIKKGDDFQFWFNNVTNPSNERHPAYASLSGQHTYFISPFFFETMMGETHNTTDNPLAGIQDPRVPYYFYNQLPDGNRTDTEAAHEYRNGNFVSIFFAGIGPTASGSNDNSVTKFGIYPIGGKYDDGEGGRVTISGGGTVGTGIAPHKIITYASLQFMLAELKLAGENTGDAEALFKEALNASIDHVHSVVEKNGAPERISNENRNAFIEAVMEKYDAATDAGKMRILMTQKWIHNILNPIDAYTDYRRTGYPLLFDAQKTEEPGYGVNLVVTEKSPKMVPLATFTTFPRSLHYPTNSEVELNANLKQKENVTVPFVFWDK